MPNNQIKSLTVDSVTYDIVDETSGYIKGLVILSYGSSTWQDFLDAYNANKVVYCRASSNSNPASGDQNRLAFLAYVNNVNSLSEVEFQYYRSVSTHSIDQQGDQVFVYKLTSNGTWSVTTREAMAEIRAGGDLTETYSGNVLTISADIPDVSGFAPLASPTFTGTVIAPTPTAGDSSTKVATTAFVQNAVSGAAYTLPIASASVLGGIKVGTGLTIDSSTGVLNATGTSITIDSAMSNTSTNPVQNKVITETFENLSIATNSTGITLNTKSIYQMNTTGSVTAGTATTPAQINVQKFSGGSFTRGSFSGGSLTMSMDSTDTKKLNITFSAATHANDTFTAASLQSGFYTAGTQGTPTAVTLPTRQSVTVADGGIVDNGHSHTITTSPQ